MIHPSYVDLMKVVNKGVEDGETPVINSRYSIVMATARRARQLVDGDESLVEERRGSKPLSIAIEELNQEKIRILSEEEFDELLALKEQKESGGDYYSEEEYDEPYAEEGEVLAEEPEEDSFPEKAPVEMEDGEN